MLLKFCTFVGPLRFRSYSDLFFSFCWNCGYFKVVDSANAHTQFCIECSASNDEIKKYLTQLATDLKKA